MADPGTARRAFGPVVLLGLASAGLAAVAATKNWVTGPGVDPVPGVTTTGVATTSPLGTALALVLLACWGVLLVTRGRFRRAITWLAALTALGYAATVAVAPFTLPDSLAEQVRRQTGDDLQETSLTAWFWIALVAALLVVAATVLAVRTVRTWPEMGTKYDAPASARAAGGAEVTSTPTENIDIWKALDEGRDPTA